MSKKSCIITSMAAAMLTTVSVLMWCKCNPKDAKNMKKSFCKATDDIEETIENMM